MENPYFVDWDSILKHVHALPLLPLDKLDKIDIDDGPNDDLFDDPSHKNKKDH
ncbi:MAG: hypothetical protein ACKO0Z_07590 [Betaproteobacteria bacterium]